MQTQMRPPTPIRAIFLGIVLTGLLIALPALAAQKKSTEKGATIDFDEGKLHDTGRYDGAYWRTAIYPNEGRVKLSIVLSAELDASYRLCVIPPRRGRECHRYPVNDEVVYQEVDGDTRDFKSHFAHPTKGIYRVYWFIRGVQLDKDPLYFHFPYPYRLPSGLPGDPNR